jgi:hypothetical protein
MKFTPKILFFVPFLLSLLVFFSQSVSAHCPLCTMGAMAAAGGAMWLGVNTIVVGVYIGAFAVSMGWWVSRLVKKDYFKGQRIALIVFSFVLTIVPMMPLIEDITPVPILWFGGYGTLFNRTYLLNNFFLGSLLGGVVVCITPWMSSKISSLRKGKIVPFQGVILTLGLLIVLGTLIQLMVMK